MHDQNGLGRKEKRKDLHARIDRLQRDLWSLASERAKERFERFEQGQYDADRIDSLTVFAFNPPNGAKVIFGSETVRFLLRMLADSKVPDEGVAAYVDLEEAGGVTCEPEAERNEFRGPSGHSER